MKPHENTEKLIKNIRYKPGDDAHKRMLSNILKALDKKNTHPAATQPNIWRIIMKSKITKLAAAAVLIIAAVFSIILLDKSTSPAYGLTEALEDYRNAETTHLRGWQYFYIERANTSELRGLPFEEWYDNKNGRFKKKQYAGSFEIDENGKIVDKPRQYIHICDGQFLMDTSWLYLFDKAPQPEVTYTKLSPFQRRLRIRQSQTFPVFYSNPDQVAGFHKIGKESIGDETLHIWQGEVTSPGKTIPYEKIKIWLSPSSGKIEKVLYWANTSQTGINWRLKIEINHIEYGKKPPDNCFSTEPPKGFKLSNTKQTAIELELGEDGQLRFYDCIGFTLTDGSVILGWHANHKPEQSQAHLFENLRPAGPLPKSPALITSLKPFPVENEVQCVGHHLTYTKKNGKFYEWAIYVSKNMPKRHTFQAYKIIAKYNDTEPRSFGGRPNLVGNELIIHSREDFDKWVLPAMAELSDDGKAPENITYKKVLALAEEIRASMQE